MAASCDPLLGAISPVESEQNFQSRAHLALRYRVAGNGGQPPSGIYTFYFNVKWDDDPAVAASEVHWVDSHHAEFVDAYQKRSDEWPMRHVEMHIYDNGTQTHLKRDLSVEEVSKNFLQ